MGGPSYEDQKRHWSEMLGYFKRGAEGEAGIELTEAIHRHKFGEATRWKTVVKDFRYAITGVDPAESLRPIPDKCHKFDTFVQDSHSWLKREFAGREGEYWEEMASFGCYWIRFKSEADLTRYKEAFASQLSALDFEEPRSEHS